MAAATGGREAGSGGGHGLMVLGSPLMVMRWVEMGCVTWKLPTVLPRSAAWPSPSAAASADETQDKTTWLFRPYYSCPGGRNPSTRVRDERVADSGRVSVLERDGSPSPSCVVVSTNIIQLLIIVNVQYWGWA